MKFTDINHDCLQSIFEYLTFEDLLNISDTTKCLRKVAGLIYYREYRNKKVVFIEARHFECRSFQVHDDCLDIQDLKTSLQVLRCFGDLIPKILFYSRGDAYHYGKRLYPDLTPYVLNYVNEYCADSLTSIKFQGGLKDIKLTNYFTKPFKNVEKVVIKHCNLLESTDLSKLFPRMRHLSCVGFMSTSCIAKHFPHLEYLDVEIWQRRESIESKMEIKSVLQLNPQLKSLRICSPGIQRYLNPPLLAAIVLNGAQESLQNLESLTMRGTYFSESKFDGNIIHMKNVRKFHIHLQGMLDESLPMIPFSFPKLETFQIQFIPNLDDPNFYKFVERHDTIKKLIIAYDSPRDGQYQAKLAQVLPNLKDIEICRGKFSLDDMLRFTNDFQVLKTVSVNLDEDIDFEKLKMRLSGDWHALIEDDNCYQRIALKRK